MFVLANRSFFPMLCLFCFAMLLHVRSEYRMLYLATGTLLFVAIKLLKKSFQITRPDGSDTESFPSGHAAFSWFIAGCTPPPWRPMVVAWALLASAARIATCRHYLTDVFTGAFIGLLFVPDIGKASSGKVYV